jgi:hypothetical protein
MKRLIAALLMFITLTASAKPFMLEFDTTTSKDTYVKFNEKDWEFVGRQNNWELYLARGETDKIKGMTVMHTMVVYDKLIKSTTTDDFIHRIFNYGLADCGNDRIFLLKDFFTDINHKVIWVDKYEFGEFITDLPEGAPRSKVYKLLCEGKHI